METLFLVLQTFILTLGITTGFAYLTLYERRLLARLQGRIGPNRAGPQGIFQPAADAVKLFFKEDIIPAQADRWVYLIAPALAVIPALIIWAVIPLGCWNVAGDYRACFNFEPTVVGPLKNIFQLTDINVGILYLLAVTSIGVYGITLAGWASNSKYAMLGAIRSSAQLISYELALGTSILGAIMMAGTLSTKEIVDYQTDLWLIVPQFLGFTIFITSATAELVRAPFDLVEAEQELTCGYNTEYGSMKFALFFMSEYIKMIVVSAIATTLYLGGWHFPGLQMLGAIVTNAAGPMAGATVVGILSLLSFLLKVAILLFVFVWVRASWPRVRYDQLMNIGWKWLLPLALLNLTMTAIVVVLVPEKATFANLTLPAQAIILLIAGIVIFFGAANLSKPNHSKIEIELVKNL